MDTTTFLMQHVKFIITTKTFLEKCIKSCCQWKQSYTYIHLLCKIYLKNSFDSKILYTKFKILFILLHFNEMSRNVRCCLLGQDSPFRLKIWHTYLLYQILSICWRQVIEEINYITENMPWKVENNSANRWGKPY